jgi:hypothetical protein
MLDSQSLNIKIEDSKDIFEEEESKDHDMLNLGNGNPLYYYAA